MNGNINRIPKKFASNTKTVFFLYFLSLFKIKKKAINYDSYMAFEIKLKPKPYL